MLRGGRTGVIMAYCEFFFSFFFYWFKVLCVMVGEQEILVDRANKLHWASFYFCGFPCFPMFLVFMPNAKLHAGEESGNVMASVH